MAKDRNKADESGFDPVGEQLEQIRSAGASVRSLLTTRHPDLTPGEAVRHHAKLVAGTADMFRPQDSDTLCKNALAANASHVCMIDTDTWMSWCRAAPPWGCARSGYRSPDPIQGGG